MNIHRLFKDARDFEACIMVSIGLNVEFAAQTTGLSKGQVYYRCKLLGVSGKAYRRGQSKMAKIVSNRIHNIALADVENKVNQIADIKK